MSPLISVIVPVYNAERYLSDCLNSVMKQTFHNYEIIVVNDGSFDGSTDVVDSFALLDKRFNVFHQQNLGITAARRKGVEVAKGDYVFFLDADDTLPEDALEILSKYIGGPFDIIVGQSHNLLYESGCEYITPDEYRQRLLFSKIDVAPWGKLIKRTLFTETTLALPRDIIVGEDWIMNCRLLLIAAYKCQNIISVKMKKLCRYVLKLIREPGILLNA